MRYTAILLLAIATTVTAQVVDCTSSPVIDGHYTAKEWSGAKQYQFDAALPEGGTVPVTLRLTNDATHLYAVITYKRSITTDTRSFSLDLHGPRGRTDGWD